MADANHGRLRAVRPIEVPEIGGAEIATWLRELAERAEQGEFRAIAIITSTTDNEIGSAWKAPGGGWSDLLAGSAVLQRRLTDEVG